MFRDSKNTLSFDRYGRRSSYRNFVFHQMNVQEQADLSASALKRAYRERYLSLLCPSLKEIPTFYFYTAWEEPELYLQCPRGDFLPPDYNFKTRAWYYEAVVAKGTSVISEPYTDVFTGHVILSITQAVFNEEDEVQFVSATDVLISELINVLDQIESGGAFIALMSS
jgi:hypothetical protein